MQQSVPGQALLDRDQIGEVSTAGPFKTGIQIRRQQQKQHRSVQPQHWHNIQSKSDSSFQTHRNQLRHTPTVGSSDQRAAAGQVERAAAAARCHARHRKLGSRRTEKSDIAGQ